MLIPHRLTTTDLFLLDWPWFMKYSFSFQNVHLIPNCVATLKKFPINNFAEVHRNVEGASLTDSKELCLCSKSQEARCGLTMST